jgi:putative transposase
LGIRKTFKYRLYPTKTQEQTLDRWLMLCRRLYNTCLEQRQIAYKMGYKLSKYDQMKELPNLKAELPEYREVDAQALQDALDRLDKSYQKFFAGGGFPKFQGRHRYNSITFKQNSWKLSGERLHLRGCGPVKVRWSRDIEGDIKTVTVKRTGSGQWFVCFSCDNVPAPVYPATDKAVGIDLGTMNLVTTSEGEVMGDTRFLQRKLKYLRRLNRGLARKKNKRSNRRRKHVQQLARLHEKVANQRRDMHHKVSATLVRENAVVVHEDISPKFMLANRHLARRASDAGWTQLLTFLQSKAAQAGRKVIAVNPRGTSQECSGCGQVVKKALHVRWHECECGCSLDRDHNAAINILKRAI